MTFPTGAWLTGLAAIVLNGTALSAQTPIRTPFEVVSLWSEEMMHYMTGARQPACSGAKLVDCTRLSQGMCDGTVDVAFGNVYRGVAFPQGSPFMQTETRDPKGFRLTVGNGGYSGTHPYQLYDDQKSLELKFECATFDTAEDCPTGMFHIGLLRGVDVRSPYGELLIDLMRHVRVHPEGRLVVSLDEAVRKVVHSGTHPFYRVRAAAECFLVPATPIDWTLPVYSGPSVTSEPLGAIVARVAPLETTHWIYRANDRTPTRFAPDWVQADWGYLYLMDQTVLDRRGDWVQLPPRPFRQAVWLQLPVRPRTTYDHDPGLHRLEPGPIYELSKQVTAQATDGRTTMVFEQGDTIVIEAIRGRVVEFRKDEEFDSPCSGADGPPAGKRPRVFRANVEAFYDADYHLRLTLAYPKGC
jgi:hypothetical protein